MAVPYRSLVETTAGRGVCLFCARAGVSLIDLVVTCLSGASFGVRCCERCRHEFPGASPLLEEVA